MEKNLEGAVRLYRLAEESFNMYAHACFCQCFAYGHGSEKDVKEAVRLIRMSADLENALGIPFLAQLYEDGDGEEQAKRLHCLAAEEACNFERVVLALYYLFGTGVKENAEEVRGFRLAVDSCNHHGQFQLARCFKYSKGVPKDEEAAVLLFRLAADSGDCDALIEICYQDGVA